MKRVLTALIGVAALSIPAPGARAQQPNTTTVLFAQTLRPAARSYPGVDPDILGIRTGMTVSQAEAIAEKSYQSKPQEYRDSDFYTYKEVVVHSHPFVQHVTFTKRTADTSDELTLYFNSPVTGNTLYAMSRMIEFEDTQKDDPKSALNDPLVSTLQASLIKKYGPISFHYMNGVRFGWAFTPKSQINCKSEDCIADGSFSWQDPNLNQLEPLFGHWGQLEGQCGTPPDGSTPFSIYANIDTNGSDQTKARDMQVSIWDPSTCIDDGKEAIKQLNADAIKFYKTVSKTPAAPTL